jgi:LuxR family transcriptional regulator, maltose regulon positive regulatory protein
MLESYLKNNNIFGILYGLIFQVISAHKIHGMKKAKEYLLKAIDLAEGDNIIMCFVELAPRVIQVLRELKEENAYVDLLLSKCEKFNEIYEESYRCKTKVQLTAREIEVMRLLDQGYSNVKFQKNSILH